MIEIIAPKSFHINDTVSEDGVLYKVAHALYRYNCDGYDTLHKNMEKLGCTHWAKWPQKRGVGIFGLVQCESK